MPEAPSIKEALQSAKKLADDFSNCSTDEIYKARRLIDAALATLQPSGERREAIARIIERLRDALVDDEPNYGKCLRMSLSYDDVSQAADQLEILASGLVQDEAGIRRDEREKCAAQADSLVTKEFDEAWIIARAIRNRNAVEIAKSSGAKVHPRVAAIRSARDGGAET
jgi:hypothetical protein